MFTSNDTRTVWQRRAAQVGFTVWNNRRLSDMTDAEIEAAFQALSRECGISYIWGSG